MSKRKDSNMSTKIFVKETNYYSFKVEKDIDQHNYEENFDYILKEYQNQEQSPFDTSTELALKLSKLESLPSSINIDKNTIENNNITITDGKNGILKSIRLYQNKYGVVELYIINKKGQIEKIITLN